MLQPPDLIGRATGEVETDQGVLVLRRIHVAYDLRVDPSVRETVERVRVAHARACPVARSIEAAIAITTDVHYV